MRTGHLIKQNGEWLVNHNDNGYVKLYPLCFETKKWLEETETEKFIKDEFKVSFEFIVKGEYCQTKDEMTRNYFAKIKTIENEKL